MTFVVTEACIGCRYGDCVEVCPQHAFHEGPNFVVIDPKACANCGLCEMVCPVSAIFAAADLPAGQKHYLALNAELSSKWPAVMSTQALPDADANAAVAGKGSWLNAPQADLAKDPAR